LNLRLFGGKVNQCGFNLADQSSNGNTKDSLALTE
jgi:hypothetical protein